LHNDQLHVWVLPDHLHFVSASDKDQGYSDVYFPQFRVKHLYITQTGSKTSKWSK